jgi:uncharacterized protein involved in type VI secretion and phage assembly
MHLFEALLDSEAQQSNHQKIQGVVIGIVTNNQNDKLGRVKVKFPWLSDADESFWARIATPMAGKEQGMYFLPEVNDEVLVAFAHGDMRFPYIIGGLWNGKNPPPLVNENGENNVRMIKSRSGLTIQLNDEEGKETIEITDKDKKNAVLIDVAQNTISITADKDITLSAPNGTIKLEAKQLELHSKADTTITVNGGMNITAKKTLNIKGKTINLN